MPWCSSPQQAIEIKSSFAMLLRRYLAIPSGLFPYLIHCHIGEAAVFSRNQAAAYGFNPAFHFTGFTQGIVHHFGMIAKFPAIDFRLNPGMVGFAERDRLSRHGLAFNMVVFGALSHVFTPPGKPNVKTSKVIWGQVAQCTLCFYYGRKIQDNYELSLIYGCPKFGGGIGLIIHLHITAVILQGENRLITASAWARIPWSDSLSQYSRTCQ